MCIMVDLGVICGSRKIHLPLCRLKFFSPLMPTTRLILPIFCKNVYNGGFGRYLRDGSVISGSHNKKNRPKWSVLDGVPGGI